MSNVREFHNKAMHYAQSAMKAAQQKKEANRIQLINRAMECEVQAAELLPEEKSSEPTRSILYRSAASFAYQAGNYTEAERLIFKGLSGYPTPMSKAQLLDVQELVQAALESQKSEYTELLSVKKIITAIYENGVLHPIDSLPFSERQTVAIQIHPELAIPA